MISFAPDADPATPEIFVGATNVVPTMKGYTASYTGRNTSYAVLASDVRNIVITRKLDNSRRFFVGLQTKIWEGSTGSWTDRSGSAYDIGLGTRWSFEQFGDTTLAVAKSVNLQQSSSGAFATVTGAPKATHCAVAQGFVMLADTNEATYGDQSDRWWCSSYLDATSASAWTPDVTTQCTTGRLIDTPGPITAMVGFGSGFVAFKENSMYIGSYTGAPAVFTWQLVPGEVGCRSKDSIIVAGNQIFWLGNDNFYTFDGSRPVPIGNPLREWFMKGETNPQFLYQVVAAYDRPNQFVWFFYPSGSSSSLDKAVVYHIPTNRWGTVAMQVEAVSIYLSDAMTYDEVGTLFTTYEDLPTNISFDSPFWFSQSQVLAVANTSHQVQTLVNSATTSSFTTNSMGDVEQFSTVSRIRPRFSQAPTSAALQHQYDNDYGDTWTNGPTATLTNGSFDLMCSARWHRELVDLIGPWELLDIRIQGSPNGTN